MCKHIDSDCFCPLKNDTCCWNVIDYKNCEYYLKKEESNKTINLRFKERRAIVKIDKQKENIANLLNLIKENPELPIVPMVATECVCGDCHAYWMAEWGNAKVTKYWCGEEEIYQHDDFSELVEEWIDNNFDDVKYKDLSEGELEALAEKIVDGYDWVDAIIVYIKDI